jgi:hypothetical protein
MRSEYEQSYSTKFDGPFTAYLYDLTLSGGADEDGGDVESPTGWFARLGRNIVTADSQGFVYRNRFASVSDARVCFAALASEYAAWADEDEDEDVAPMVCEDCGEDRANDYYGGLCWSCAARIYAAREVRP